MITGVEAALPVLRAATDILRELARELEPRLLFDKEVVNKIDMAANQIENLADHLEQEGKKEKQ